MLFCCAHFKNSVNWFSDKKKHVKRSTKWLHAKTFLFVKIKNRMKIRSNRQRSLFIKWSIQFAMKTLNWCKFRKIRISQAPAVEIRWTILFVAVFTCDWNLNVKIKCFICSPAKTSSKRGNFMRRRFLFFENEQHSNRLWLQYRGSFHHCRRCWLKKINDKSFVENALWVMI